MVIYCFKNNQDVQRLGRLWDNIDASGSGNFSKTIDTSDTPEKLVKLTNIVNPMKIVKLANLVMVKLMTDEFHDLAFNLSLGSRQQHTRKDNKRQ